MGPAQQKAYCSQREVSFGSFVAIKNHADYD